jgi:hypothetical protein
MTTTAFMDGGGTHGTRGANPIASLSTSALLGRSLLIINSFTFLAMVTLVLFGSIRGNPYGVTGLVILLSLYYFSLIGYPVSVFCLWRKPKPLWAKIALFLNAPFFLFQALILAGIILVVFVKEWA